ncbi:GntR family transcriptional regulator [Magnetospira sp. QH-2]|uniref:GntR family transcriptional regulator n=1 Tax=Magnetospira sp. (strain QH-2) TaxID=1288970 RepID=UPI0003E80F36|nr:GntR family transcriptional regulator [Magnetospira sp. QH-2]CCQ74537.1 putative Regulatory protein GntR family [Magnetospira sp. QH-2]
MNTSKNKSADASQSQSAYARLLEMIRAGNLGPGDRLTETDLAQRLDVSRTPIREAMRRLEADGLVVHEPHRGAVIRTLDYNEVMELYEVRAVLESTAARMAARSASEIEISELATLNGEMAKVIGDADEVFRLNRQFHLGLLDSAKNRFLVKSVNALQKTLLILGPTTLAEADRAEETVDEHEELLVALRNRDADSAEAAMKQHIEKAHRMRLRQLRDRVRPLDEE